MKDTITAILPIISILFVICITTFILFIICSKKINLTNEKARKIEILGYILLFAVIVWEFILKNILSDSFYNDNWFYLSEKLKAIYILLNDIVIDNTANYGKFGNTFFNERSDFLQIQLITIDFIEFLLKLISTIFIAIGRFHELKQWSKNKNISESHNK